MDSSLSAAQSLAERVRYSGDLLRRRSDGDLSAIRNVLGASYQSELQVSPAVTPGLAKRLDEVCQRLQMPEGAVHAFIYASPEVQAECYASSIETCILRFSSALIGLLDEDEFGFVAGHEVGHFLLGHGVARAENRTNSVEDFMQQRAQEISVDRVGLIACRSLDVAVRAMMKTVSGLSGEHLRFDVGAFLRQLDYAPECEHVHASTHPTILVRCRALLWFSLNDAFNRGTLQLAKEDLLRLDRHIKRDIDKYVDGPTRRMIEDATNNLLLWVIANHAVQDGVLDRQEQEAVVHLVGRDTLERLKGFLADIPASEVRAEVYQRLEAAKESLEQLIPSSFKEASRVVDERVAEALMTTRSS
jgi:hypothetical protein